MALTDNDSGLNVSMPVAPAYGSMYGGCNNGMCGFGGADGWWILLLLLFAGNGFGGGFGGWGGGFGGMYEFPWLLNGQNMINANTNAGFDHAATQSAISGLQNAVTSGFGDVQTALCGGFGNVQNSLCSGFAGVNASINGAQNAMAQQMYTNQISDLERSFAAQTASTQGMSNIQSQLAQCCCDNRLASANLQNVIQSENCADRAALSDGIRDLLAATTAQNQRILDQLCQDKIDAKNDTIAQLRQELLYTKGQAAAENLYVRGQASQDIQTAQILAGQNAEVDALYNRLNTCPVPTTPVYGRTPIFTCQNGGCGCGCGGSF